MRFQLDISEEQLHEMEQLMVDTGIATRKDLFNHALTLFEWAVNERMTGRLIASVDVEQDHFKEIVSLPLERAAKHAKAVQSSKKKR